MKKTSKNEEQLEIIIFDQHTKEPIPHHYTHRRKQSSEGYKPIVVKGQALTINQIMERNKLGIPTITPTRTLETYFKNMDLTDIDTMRQEYIKIADKTNRIQKAIDKKNNELKIQQADERQMILEFVQTAKKAQQQQPAPVAP